jgi:ATP-binding cassette subfamily F protein uup
VLDEPTNDLDIDTLELLEELLEDYEGTVFLVSHDRMFLDNVVTQVIVSEGNGQWREFVGGYTDWERARDAGAAAKAGKGARADAKAEAKTEAKPAEVAPPGTGAGPTGATMSASAQNGPAKKVKLSYKEQRELDELPKLIADLEDEQALIMAQLNSPDFYKTNPADARRINARYQEIDEQLVTALERWEAIELKAKG